MAFHDARCVATPRRAAQRGVGPRRRCAPPRGGSVPTRATIPADHIPVSATPLTAILLKRIGSLLYKVRFTPNIKMFATLLDIDLQTDYAAPYEANRAAYLLDAEALKKATGPYKAARDADVAATATFTKSLYE